jgi:hypothetical protein
MNSKISSPKLGKKTAIATACLFLVAISCGVGPTQDASKFPEEYDAVMAAPASHKAVFENALVRVLPPGKTAPLQNTLRPA